MLKKLIIALIAIIMTSSVYAQSESSAAAGAAGAGTVAGVSVATAVAIGAAVVGIAVAADDDDDSSPAQVMITMLMIATVEQQQQRLLLTNFNCYMHRLLLRALLVGPFLHLFNINTFASDLGTTGIIDIPTARMMDDGVLKTTVSKQDSISVYSLNYQATPWFETTFRYAGFEDFFYYDRSYEAKVRLIKETAYLPQVSVGIRDLVGTGVFGSEYIVGSKKIGQFDLTLGVGWGRLAGTVILKTRLQMSPIILINVMLMPV